MPKHSPGGRAAVQAARAYQKQQNARAAARRLRKASAVSDSDKSCSDDITAGVETGGDL